MNIILALEVLCIIVLGLPVFMHYLCDLAYDLFCIIWNTVAFVVNTAVFLFRKK